MPVTHMAKVHNARRQQAQRHHSAIKRLIILMKRNPLSGKILIHKHLVKRPLAYSLSMEPLDEELCPAWYIARRIGLVVRMPVRLASPFPCHIPRFSINCSNQPSLLVGIDIVTVIRKSRYW